MEYGLQLFSVRDLAEKNLDEARVCIEYLNELEKKYVAR